MNKEVFHGFINGVVAMYQLGSSLDYHLLMEWECEHIGNNKLRITCDYCYERYDRLLSPGDYETPPQYEEIENRDKIVIEVTDRDTIEIATYNVAVMCYGEDRIGKSINIIKE